jgi:hypothetical protein
VKPGGVLPGSLRTLTQAVAASSGPAAVLGGDLLLEADPLYILKYAIESAHSLNPDKIVTAIEGIKDKSFIAPSYTYTFGASRHDGYPASGIHMCTLSQVASFGTPVLAPNSP